MREHIPGQSLDALKKRRRALLRELSRINLEIGGVEQRLTVIKKRLALLARMRRKAA